MTASRALARVSAGLACGLRFVLRRVPRRRRRAEVDAGGYLRRGGLRLTREARRRVSSPSREAEEAAEECFGDGETEDGVSDELELLVVGGGVGEQVRGGLVGEGAVGERALEEGVVLEGVAEGGARGFSLRHVGGSPLWLTLARKCGGVGVSLCGA